MSRIAATIVLPLITTAACAPLTTTTTVTEPITSIRKTETLALGASFDDYYSRENTKLCVGSATWAGGAVAAAIIPVRMEGRRERKLPPIVRKGASTVGPCGPRQPRTGARVVIRVDDAERTAVTDARGRVSFEGVDAGQVELVLVDDAAVTPPKPPASR